VRAIAVVGLALIACRAPRIGAPCSPPIAFAPWDQPRAPTAPPPPPDGLLDRAVAWYQRSARATQLPGVGCPFAPTCSVYARRALHAYGPFGLALIVDRLIVRENPLAAAYYPVVCVDHTTRLDDALP
jgi:putative component of membrane protein insertase Oxa1/YidC/SpoIIIJ protein YidD